MKSFDIVLTLLTAIDEIANFLSVTNKLDTSTAYFAAFLQTQHSLKKPFTAIDFYAIPMLIGRVNTQRDHTLFSLSAHKMKSNEPDNVPLRFSTSERYIEL